MNFSLLFSCVVLACFFAFQVDRLVAATQSDSTIQDIHTDAKKSVSDFSANFPIKVSIKTKPETPTIYERTRINLETYPQFSVEVVEVRDETRGIASKYNGTDISLENLFGPKTGLTDHVTISAIVRLNRQPGEAIVRRSILLRNVLPELRHKVESQGPLRVNVQLDVPVKPEATLSEEAIAAQRKSVNDSQDRLINALAGTDYKIVRRFEFVPGFVLEVGPKSLALLDRQPQILTVTEEHFVGIRVMPQ